MDDYSPKVKMSTVEMGGYNIVLGVVWLWTLGLIAVMDFYKLYMSFSRMGIATLSKVLQLALQRSLAPNI